MTFETASTDAFHAPFSPQPLFPPFIEAPEEIECHDAMTLWLKKTTARTKKTMKIAGPDTLDRVDTLREVKAHCRGLSIEPLWERIPPEDLDLTGIDWVIGGGESGSGALTRPFHTEWAEELHAHCRKHGVAFFLKQLGRNPVIGGKPVRLSNPHGGDWSEWPAHLRVREYPAYLHNYRKTPGKIRKNLTNTSTTTI